MAQKVATKLLVIGGGPGGYAAAFRAADLGLEVVMVGEDPMPGGVCLLRGCIPSKALLHAGHLIEESRAAKDWGLTFGEPVIDAKKLNAWKQSIVDKLAAGVYTLCGLRKVTWVSGRANFLSSRKVELLGKDATTVIEYEHCILAVGSRPTRIRAFDVPSGRVVDSSGALDVSEIPRTLLVIGGGYIGLELGSVYASLGTKVKVVELGEAILPGADRDLVKPLEEKVRRQLAAVYVQTKVAQITDVQGGVLVKFEGPAGAFEETFEKALVSIGRRPNSDGIGIENTAAKVDARGFVVVDERQATADPAIHAIGDVAGPPLLAHKAAYEGKIAAEVLAGEPAAHDARAIPAVVFTDPEIAWCGLTETEARAKGIAVKTARFPWAASGRAQTLGSGEGLTKIIVDPETERVLGVGIVGAGAGELISEGVVAVEMGASASDLAMSIHPHPTLSETLAGAAEVFLGSATDLFVKRRA